MGDQASGRRIGGIGGSERKRPKPGILRLDISKPRRSSGGSVEFRNQPELLGEGSSPSGATSPPQLSVTWASLCDSEEPAENTDNTSPATSQMQNLFKSPKQGSDRRGKRLLPGEDRSKDSHMDLASPLDVPGENNSEDEDYSLSVSAIMQRRASVRGHRKKGYRSPRRTSSPMDHVLGPGGLGGERRRSSVYTTSSGDTAISLDDGTNEDSSQEQIYENIRLHKEVLQSVKQQPWSIRRKLRLVRQAKAYVARHEGVLQERFALSGSTRDLWARFKIVMATKWTHFKRELLNLSTILIPWELRIKEIESHFGSVVASYFTFLRWLFWVNIIIAVILITFIVIPELLTFDSSIKDDYKKMTPGELKIAGNFMTIWEFEGYLKYSPIFYGYYSNVSGAVRKGYKLPLAYFLTGLVVYIYSFVATLRKMAENSRTSKLSSKDDECVFSWKIFTGWDFMIGHAETAHNRIASVVLGFKEALLEEAEKKKDTRNWRVILLRIFVNLVVSALLCASAYAVVLVVNRSDDVEPHASWIRRNEITLVLSSITVIFPMIFEALGLLEKCHPRHQLRIQLARIMLLNLLNLYSLIFALFNKITKYNRKLSEIQIHLIDSNNEKNSLVEKINDLLGIVSTTQSWNYESPDNNNLSAESLLDDKKNFLENITTGIYENVTNFIDKYIVENITTFETEVQTYCYSIPVNCSKPQNFINNTLATSLLLLNLSTTLLPNLWNDYSSTTDIYLPNVDDIIRYHENGSAWDFYFSLDNEGDDGSLNSATPDYTDYTEEYTDKSPSSPIPMPREKRGLPIPKLPKVDYNIKTTPFDPNAPTTIRTTPSTTIRTTRTTTTPEPTTTLAEEITDIYTTISTRLATEDVTPFPTELDITSITETLETALSTFIENVTTMDPNGKATVRDKFFEIIDNVTSEIVTGNYDTESFEEDLNDTCTELVCVPIEDMTTPSYTDISDGDFSSSPQVATVSSLEPTTNYETTVNYELVQMYQYSLKNLTRYEAEWKKELKGLCWETMFGQELVKLTVMDLVVTISQTLIIDFIRALFVRYMNDCWCWDMEKKFPQYGDFKIAENILHLVHNQGQVWMGMFFSPGLAVINLIKLVVIMYIRSWAVLTCNVPHEVVFRASRSNNFYLSLLLIMLFLAVLPVGYAIVWLKPSWHCGPFANFDHIYKLFTETIFNALPESLHPPLEYLTSPSTVIPLLLLLILIIYYLVSLTGALREANQDLKNQLKKERSEERKKMFKDTNPKPEAEAAQSSITTRWKKVLEASSPVTPSNEDIPEETDDPKFRARKDLLARIMKGALRKGSATSEDESIVGYDNIDDETDTEHHDSLPHDDDGKHKGQKAHKKAKKHRKPSIIDVLNLAKKETGNEAHPNSRFKIDKKPDEPTINENQVLDDNDPESNSRIVSERRRSLLKRQQKLNESSGSSVQEKDEVNTNYEIVNEKNKEVEKQSKLKSLTTPEPEVFKFDEKSLQIGKGKSADAEATEHPAGSGTNAASDVLRKLLQKKLAAKRGGITPVVPPTVPDAIPEQKPTSSSPPLPPPPPSGDKINTVSKGRRKLGSFLALVNKAVTTKKPEDEALAAAASSTSQSIPTPTEKGGVSTEDNKPRPTATVSARVVPPSKLKKERGPKRQDSQTSIWSDNIPVITISKTGSEECILECSDKEADPSKNKPKPN